MRPKAIEQFEYVYLGQMLLSIVATYLTADKTAAMLQNSGMAVSDAMLITVQWVFSALFVGIALLASRRRSNVARWIIVVLSAFGAASFLFTIGQLPMLGRVAILAVSQCVLSIVVLYLLFRPEAKAWFAGRSA